MPITRTRTLTRRAMVCSSAVLTVAAVVMAGPALAAAGNDISLVSRGMSGAPANSGSSGGAVSGNGRYVCFDSTASDIVARDTVGTQDVFRYDSTTGVTAVVSHNPAGKPAGRSRACRISDNGRYIAYETTSPVVAPGLPGRQPRIVLYDADTRTATIVSKAPDGTPTTVRTQGVDMSSDGRYVVYVHQSLSAGGGYHEFDVYRYDRIADTTTSLVHEGEVSRAVLTGPSVSGDGRYVAYLRTPPKGKQVVGSISLYLLDSVSGTTTLVSGTPKGTLNGAQSPDLSDNGRFLTYSSTVVGLAPGDTTPADDVFLYDATTGRTSLVSRTAAGVAGNERSIMPSIGGSGRHIAYSSYASDLVAGDVNGQHDVFVYDRLTGTTELVSVALDGGSSAGSAIIPSIGGQGNKIAFRSSAADLVAGGDSLFEDILLWTRPL